MNYKKIFVSVALGFFAATLLVSHLVDAANLNQAVSTLPSNDEWSIMARASIGQNSGSAFLRSPISGGSATDYEKRILAITAIGENPRTFGTEDFVSRLKTFYDGIQIGDPTLLNDDIFGILALISTGLNSDSAVTQTRQFILSHQNSDGGWGFATNVGSDSNTTAMAIAALAKTGGAPASSFDYISRNKNSSGGYSFIPNTTPDGASTAWVIIGLNSAAHFVPNDAIAFLDNLQLSDGSFKWRTSDTSGSSLVTAYAVMALSGKGIPINTVAVNPNPSPAPTPTPQPNPSPSPSPSPTPSPSPSPTPSPNPSPQPSPQPSPSPLVSPSPSPIVPNGLVHITINYPGNKIYAGNITFSQNQTALQTLTTAATQINLLYQVKQTGLGQFVSSIDGYNSTGSSGWQYAVNGQVPAVGAADYILHNQDQLQWFFGSANSNPY